MSRIDVFVSAPADLQKEHAIAEQVIRSAAAEFNVPINVSYSNPLRGSSPANGGIESEEFPAKSTPVLCPCFWEHSVSEEDSFLEQLPNTGLYDLVICILHSRLETTLPPQCVMPDGSQPMSATDYEVAWALYQSERAPGCPGLHIYRNRSTPAAPLELKEQRESPFRQCDPVQAFCAAWEKEAGAGFRECCHDFQDLEEFERLFGEHFRDFLARRLDPGIASGKASPRVPYFGSNPFRGLNFFDCEHSALYHGRTRAVGEVLDILKQQAAAKKRFLLVLGPSGSGKSSFVRAGVLPLVTRGGTPAGAGPWRRALTRPGAARDPFESLAAALFAKSALPELQQVASPEESSDLASRLRKDPDGVAAQIGTLMDQFTGNQLDQLLENRKAEGLPAKENESIEISNPRSVAQLKPMAQLALIVDQLEELFTTFSPVLQKKYIAALCALANCERVFIIATLRSDFYPHYQRFSELTAFGGRYDLQPPTPGGIGNIIRFRTEAAGLQFEQDSETSRCLDETILKAAVANPAPLPLLEHLLSRLYQRQHGRKDGLLLWSDYRAVGGLHDALAQHAEFAFLNLKGDEQRALKFVIRNLLVPTRGEDGFLNRRSIKYRDLILSPQLNERQKAGTRGLIDRFIKEGLLSAETDPQQELLISIPQEAMLHRWPRLGELVSEERRFLRMRDRLDANVKLWIGGERQREDLLDRGIGLAEAQILLTDFKGQLNEIQIDYIRKSFARHKPRRKLPQKIGLAAIVGLAIFAAFVGGERFKAESRHTNKGQEIRLGQQNTNLDARQRSELEAERGTLELRLKEAEQNLQIAQQKADSAFALGTQLKKNQEEKAQLAQQNADLDNSRRSQLLTQHSLETQLKKTEEKLQIAQQNADLANSERSALEAELRKAQEEKAQLAQQSSNLADNQQSEQETQRSRETQLKDTQDKLQLAQKNADLANTQRAASEAELKKAQEESAQLVQQNSNLADAQSSEQKNRRSRETQLKDTQDKLQLAQKNADLANTQRATLEADLKEAREEKAHLAQQNSNLADAQSGEHEARRNLETQLKDAQDKLQLAQKNADLANTQRAALEADLKEAQEEKARLAQQNSNLADAQSGEHEARRNLETQLKDTQDKLQLAQKNADLANTQRATSEAELKKAQEESAQLVQQNSNLADAQSSEQKNRRSRETQLKDTQDKLQLAQKNADLANTQRATLEADLKEAREEKAHLAQQNSNLADAQSGEHEARRNLETQLKDAQDKLQLAQKNADLANTQRATLEADLKEAQEEKARLAQQNSNLADAQSSEQKARRSLETQLKDTQDKLRTAQENADLADTQRSALDNQLKNEQVKLGQAQAEADHANSQLRAIQAQLKQEPEREQNRQANTDSSTSEIRGVSPDALTGSKTEVVLEEKQDNLPGRKDALLTPPQDPSPLPSPAKESEALNSPKSQSDQSALTDDKAFAKQFVLGYIKSVASDDTSLQRPYFGEQVNYYGEGVIGSPKIEASLKRYRTEWPVRNWEPRGEARVARLKDPNLFAVLQPFNWAVSDGSNQAHGNATLYARVRKTSQGKFQIEYLRQLTADRSGRRHRKRK